MDRTALGRNILALADELLVRRGGAILDQVLGRRDAGLAVLGVSCREVVSWADTLQCLLAGGTYC